MRGRERGADSVSLLLLLSGSRLFLVINREHVALDHAALTPTPGLTAGTGGRSEMGTKRGADRRRGGQRGKK